MKSEHAFVGCGIALLMMILFWSIDFGLAALLGLAAFGCMALGRKR